MPAANAANAARLYRAKERRPSPGQAGGEDFEHLLRRQAIAGELAAVDRNQPWLVPAVHGQDDFPRAVEGVSCAVGQDAQAGPGGDQLLFLPGEVVGMHAEQVIDFLPAGLDRRRIAFKWLLGCSDQRVPLPGHGEHRALVCGCFRVVDALLDLPFDLDVGAGNQVHIAPGGGRGDAVHDPVDPGASGIHQRGCTQLRRFPADLQFNPIGTALAGGGDQRGGGQDAGAEVRRRVRHGPGQGCVIGLTVVVSENRLQAIGPQAVEFTPFPARHTRETCGLTQVAQRRIER